MSKKDEYKSLAARSPVAAARFLEQHAREIYPSQPAHADTGPEPATVHDIEAAKAYRAASRESPTAAARMMERHQGAIVRGCEALRGARPMPPTPPDDNNPPPLAA